ADSVCDPRALLRENDDEPRTSPSPGLIEERRSDEDWHHCFRERRRGLRFDRRTRRPSRAAARHGQVLRDFARRQKRLQGRRWNELRGYLTQELSGRCLEIC